MKKKYLTYWQNKLTFPNFFDDIQFPWNSTLQLNTSYFYQQKEAIYPHTLGCGMVGFNLLKTVSLRGRILI